MQEDLQGVWRLSRWSVVDRETAREHLPFGGNVEGYLIYTDEGWVSASLMQRKRSAVCEERRQLRRMCEGAPRDEGMIGEVWRWFLAGFGYVAYCGRFEVYRGQVHHHLKTSLIPQWVGTTLTRDMELRQNGQELLLTAAGEAMVDHLLWQKVSDA